MHLKAPPAPPQVASWTGLYLGVNAGFLGLDTSAAAHDGVGDQRAGSQTVDGAIFGGQVGANWQVQNFLLGAEADLGTVKISSPTNTSSALNTTFTTDMTSLGTVRGRAGVLVSPALLLYGTGGLAWAQVNDNLPTLFGGFTSNGTRSGWTAGGGAEWMFASHWSVKAEGLYLDFGSTTVGDSRGRSGYAGTFKTTAEIGRVGVNFHW